MKENSNYKVYESNYEEYILRNGKNMEETAQAIKLRNKDARYFVIEKNNEYFSDFVIYNKDNWITLDRMLYKNNELVNCILNYLKENKYEYVTEYFPDETMDIAKYIKDHYNVIDEIKIVEGPIEAIKLKIKI